MVEVLIANGAIVCPKDFRDLTPLHYAAGGDAAVVEVLIARGANVNTRDDLGNTPLYHATQVGADDVVKALEQHGAVE